MAPKIPEFILRNMFVKNSLTSTADGFAFALKDTYAPATVQAFRLEVDGEAVPQGDLSLQLEDQPPVAAASISAESPFALPVDKVLKVVVAGHAPGALRIHVETREVGVLSFSIKTDVAVTAQVKYPRENIFKRLFRKPIRSQMVIELDQVVGEINPHVYGHFVEHLENCVYGGVFSKDGASVNEDVLTLVKALKPPNIRYPGGNFASDYHWEEGIGPKDQRPVHTDRAWHVQDPNQVGTDEFLQYCEAVGAAPFLVINDGSGTPEEAARWVAYCNDPATTPMGKKRAENGHPEPYGVKLWGLGNEVWGEWQIGHTDAAGYVERIRAFIDAMRAVDPEIKLVAVGLDQLEGDPRNATEWNQTVLEGLGDAIDFLSFHVYQPSEEGYQESYDPARLYHSIVAAPHSTEEAIKRMADLIKNVVPGRKIGIALDEYNVKYPPQPGARSMHDLVYTLRDGLYVAGMLNAFHRQCEDLQIANIAMLVNVLPLIVKPEGQAAFPTPLYFPFLLYSKMESQVLSVKHWSPTFAAEGLGLNISPQPQVPYVDVTVTSAADGSRVVLGLLNRHPLKDASLMIGLKGEDQKSLKTTESWLMNGPDPLAANTADAPDVVKVTQEKPPALRFGWIDCRLPPASLQVLVIEKRRD